MPSQQTTDCNPTRNSHSSPSAMIGLAIVGLAYLVLNFLTPEYHDDFVYKFMFEGGGVNYGHRVQDVGDLIQSQVCHYSTVNGRSLVHFLVQLFTGLLGKQVFNVVNAIIFCIFIGLLKRSWGKRHDLLGMAVALVLVLLMPRFKDTMLWMTGSINYLWSATATLLFLMIYEKRRHQAVDKRMPLTLVAAFLLGWTHEGITLPLAAALVIHHLSALKRDLGQQGLWLALAYLAGGCVILLAPGTIARSGASDGLTASSLALRVIAGFTVLGKLHIIYLALSAIAIGWLADRETVKRVITGNRHLLLAALLACGIVLMAGMPSARTAFGLELFAMLLLLRLLGEWAARLRPQTARWCGMTLTAGLITFYGLLLSHTIPSWQESRRLIAQIEHTDDGIIGTREHHAGLFSSHVCTMLSPDSTVNAMNYDPHGWPASIAATYGCDSLVFLPQTFLDDLKTHPERYERLSLDTPHEFYVRHIDDTASIKQVEMVLTENDFADIPFIFRPIARKMNRYTDTRVTTDKWATVTLYGRRYLLVKRDHELDRRLQEIIVLGNVED